MIEEFCNFTAESVMIQSVIKNQIKMLLNRKLYSCNINENKILNKKIINTEDYKFHNL